MNDKEPIRIEVGSAVPGAPVRVGKRLPGVNVGQARDMLLGKEVPEEVAQKAVQASENNHPDLAGHVPTIAALASPEGAWGAFCMRCSAEAQQYIYPCKIDSSDWPPQVLIGVEVTQE